MIKKILKKIQMYKNPIKYARKIGVKVGEDCRFVSPPKFGSEPWLIEIGNHVELTSDIVFLTHDGATWVFRNEEKYSQVLKYGKIIIKDNCFIGYGTTILPGVCIGPNSIVGAGSLVTKSIPSNEVWGGNPARFICTLEDYKQRCLNGQKEYDREQYKAHKEKVISELLKDKMKL